MKGFIKKITSNKKVFIALLFLIGFLIFIVVGAAKNRAAKKEEAQSSSNDNSVVSGDYVVVSNPSTISEDNALMRMQPGLTESYGKAPDGYIWNMDGTLMSLGDKSMTAEEVVYAYLNGLRTLDFSTAQKFSRGSSVVNRYSDYFDKTKVYNDDYYSSFTKNVYKYCLMSFYIKGVESSTIFAENKRVFTVKVNMIDLTDKDFWEKDKDKIYSNLRLYNRDQGDATKGEIYLYDYISRYYSSEDVAKRDVNFDIVVEKYPDLDTGWLVSIDTDVDNACRYADGKLIADYIRDKFNSEQDEYFRKKESSVEG